MNLTITDIVHPPKPVYGKAAVNGPSAFTGGPVAFAPEGKWSYAGGYGFWCNSSCAASKDAAKKAAEDAAAAQQNAIIALSQPTTTSNINIGAVAIGSIMAMVTVIGIVYFIKK